MTTTQTQFAELSTATDISALAGMLSDEWYDAVEGVYTSLPTWGPKTESVLTQIGNSCANGDIVSWDTRDENPANHLYLRRSWNEAHQSWQDEHVFSVVEASEYDEEALAIAAAVAAWPEEAIREYIESHDENDVTPEAQLLAMFRSIYGRSPEGREERLDMWSHICCGVSHA